MEIIQKLGVLLFVGRDCVAQYTIPRLFERYRGFEVDLILKSLPSLAIYLTPSRFWSD